MKRIISFISSTIILFSFYSFPLTKISGETISSFYGDMKFVKIGSTTDYTLSLDLVDYDVQGLQFSLSFDTSAFYLDEDVSKTITLSEKFSTAMVSINSQLGTIKFNWEAGTLPITNNCEIFKVHMETYSDAEPFYYVPHLTIDDFYDSELYDIPYIINNGQITLEDELRLLGIELKTQPVKKNYYVNEIFDSAGLSVTAYYNDNTTQTITDNLLDYSYDFSSVGTKEVKVSFVGIQSIETVYVNVSESTFYPTDITSNLFSIANGFIGRISAGTSVEAFLNGINEKAYIEIFNNNQKASINETVKTGMILKLIINGNIVKTLTVIVTGDINGDGEISLTDAIIAKSFVLKNSVPTIMNVKSADVNSDNDVSLTDYMIIKAHFLKIKNVVPQPLS